MNIDGWIVVHQQKLLEKYLKVLKDTQGDRFGAVVRELHDSIQARTFEETERQFLYKVIETVVPPPATADSVLRQLHAAGWPGERPAIQVPPPPYGNPAPRPPVATPPPPPPPGAVGVRAGWTPEQWAQDAGIRHVASPVTHLPPLPSVPVELDPDGLPPLPPEVGVAPATPPLFKDKEARDHFIHVLGLIRNELRIMRMSCPGHNWLDLQRCGVLTPEIVRILRLVDKANKDIDWRTKRERRELEKSAGVRSTARHARGAGQ